MAHILPPLPYAEDALAPVISAETIRYHYGKHHRSYVDKLNAMVADSEWEQASLEDLVMRAEGGLFNNAAQAWNHSFYWQGLGPDGGGKPEGALAAAIDASFGSFGEFRKAFNAAGAGNFGSGWTWLVRNADGALEIVNTDDAGNPLRDGQRPLLTVDVWEHAYYIDYRNGRGNYLDAIWDIVNWEFVAGNLG